MTAKRRIRPRWRPESAAVLASGGTIQEAATAGGVSPRTINRHLKLYEGFRAEIRRIQDANVGQTSAMAATMAISALATLDAIRQDVTAPCAGRVAACRTILEVLTRVREHGALSTRLDDIERALSAGRPAITILPPAGGGFPR